MSRIRAFKYVFATTALLALTLQIGLDTAILAGSSADQVLVERDIERVNKAQQLLANPATRFPAQAMLLGSTVTQTGSRAAGPSLEYADIWVRRANRALLAGPSDDAVWHLAEARAELHTAASLLAQSKASGWGALARHVFLLWGLGFVLIALAVFSDAQRRLVGEPTAPAVPEAAPQADRPAAVVIPLHSRRRAA